MEGLREVAEEVLRDTLEEDTTFRWPERSGENIQHLEVRESAELAEVGVFTDGGGLTSAATITQAIFLERYATVMDVEMLAVAMGWEILDTVITDSQAAIGKIQYLELERPKG